MDGDILEVLAKRRTIRRFTSEEVPQEKIDALIQAGFYAPTYLNRKPWHFVVVRDKTVQEELGNILGVRPYVQEASAVIVLAGDPEVSSGWQLDVTAAAENILIAASAMGLGAAWVGNPHGPAWDVTDRKIKDLLQAPARISTLGLIAVGVAAINPEPHSREDRWDTSRVHYGKFGGLKGSWGNINLK